MARDWLELALDYRCNLRCLGCRACHDTGERLDGPAVMTLLRSAHAEGTRKLWIGGGEPTLRDDLGAVIASARKVGFETVLLQTNGLRLAYPAYARALVDAGVTDVRLNLKTHRADVHDALSGQEGAHALLTRALDVLAHLDVRIAADVLLTRTTAPDLAETVRTFADRVRSFTLWLLSSTDSDDPQVAREVPQLAAIAPFVEQASAIAAARGIELVSLHTPPCTLPVAARSRFLPAASLRLTVVDPSGRAFPLERSPFEGGVHVEACARCTERPRCPGARADYLHLHGDAEFQAI